MITREERRESTFKVELVGLEGSIHYAKLAGDERRVRFVVKRGRFGNCGAGNGQRWEEDDWEIVAGKADV